MKSLDEVIYAYERCNQSNFDDPNPCGNCAYHSVEHGGCKCHRNADALHYLKVLKLFRQTPLMQGIHKAQKESALYPVDDWGEDEEKHLSRQSAVMSASTVFIQVCPEHMLASSKVLRIFLTLAISGN